MKLKTLVSTSLAIGFLFNTTLSSLASSLSADGRYETFNDSNITINDVLEEDEVDMKIGGNTLVNLLGEHTYIAYEDMITFDNDSNTYRFNKDIIIDVNSGRKFAVKFDNSLVETGKTYTLSFNIVENTLLYGDNGEAVAKFNLTNYNEGCHLIYPDDIGFQKVILNQPNETTHNGKSYLEVHDSAKGSLVVKDIMILEGDWSNKEIPDYFEGMQSSFENNLVTQEMINNREEKQENLGKYKAKIKSIGKNLVNTNKFSYDKTKAEVFIENDEVVIRTTDSAHGTWALVKFAVKVPKNTILVFNPNVNIINNGSKHVIITDSNNKLLEYNTGEPRTFSSPSDIIYIALYTTTTVDIIGSETRYRPQLEIGSTATEYEQYKESTNTFYLNSPLLEGDTIEIISGQATHVKRYREVLVDGNEDSIVLQNDFDKQDETIGFNIRGFLDGSTTYGLADSYSDKFICYPQMHLHYNDIEGISQGFTSLYLRINRNKLATEDVGGLRQWLQANPVTVVYKLTSPIYEPIKADLSVQLFEKATYISNNSNIPANIEITVDRILNRTVESIELAKTSPTVENLARARMWSNLIKESSKKDELQNEINDITDIEDLELERKSVTANVDLYVKSENTLSMSLDTNHVTFEGYSGVSDMEKLGAVNISINSSLPYSLNAYMPVELSNSDGSNKMPTNLLNIRENGIGDYKRFVNTSDKVVLNDSCEAGNDIMHKIDLKLSSMDAHKSDVYKAVVKFEAVQK